MKTLIVTLLAASTILAVRSSGTAMSQESNTPPFAYLQKGEGVTQAMARVGCKLDNLSTVVSENKIAPARFNKLPLNLQVNLPADCHNEPSKAISAKSKQLIRENLIAMHLYAHARHITRHRIRYRHHPQPQIQEQNQEAQQQNLPAATTKTTSAAPVQPAPAINQQQSWLSQLNWSELLAIAIGTIALLALLLWLILRSTGYKVVKSEQIVPLLVVVGSGNGHSFEFTLSHADVSENKIDWRYSCPLCRENNLKAKNCLPHLREAHKEKLVLSELSEDNKPEHETTFTFKGKLVRFFERLRHWPKRTAGSAASSNS